MSDHQAHAANVRRNAADALARIEADVTLSPVGKRREAARIAQNAQQRLDELKSRADAEVAAAKRSASDSLFRVRGSDQVSSYRDAIGRAQQADDLDSMYRVAQSTGDRTLAQAVAFVAAQRIQEKTGPASLRGIVSDYAEGIGHADAVDQVLPAQQSPAQKAMERMTTQAEFSAPSSKSLDGLSTAGIAQLAADES